jgi:hypothetical protein
MNVLISDYRCLINNLSSLWRDVCIWVFSPRNVSAVAAGSVRSFLRIREASYAWHMSESTTWDTFWNYALSFEQKVFSETEKAESSQDVEVSYWRQFCKRTFACFVTTALLHRIREKLTTFQTETNGNINMSSLLFKSCKSKVIVSQ